MVLPGDVRGEHHRGDTAVSDGLLFLVSVLAVYCGVRFVVKDTITDPIRQWANRRRGPLGELLGCPRCVGFYVAGAVTLALVLTEESVPLPLLWWPATWGGGSLLAIIDLRVSARG